MCDVVIALTWYLRIQDALRFQEPFLTALATRLDACCMSPLKVAFPARAGGLAVRVALISFMAATRWGFEPMREWEIELGGVNRGGGECC